jgi:maltose O-acetyltransferase
MTEKEKAALGLLYDNNNDPALLAERLECQSKCFEYNQLHPRQAEEKQKLIHEIIPDLGEGAYLEQPFHCDFGYNIHIGKKFYSNFNLVILDEAPVTIGDYVFIAPDCGLYTAGHPINAVQRNAGLEYAKPITIGSHVWIGGGVKVMPGVTIGSNVVIGGGSVVTHDIPDGVIAVGNPCRVIREIAEEDQIK